MKALPIALGMAFAASPLLAAPDSPLKPAFGNTVVSTYPDGRTALLWLKPDGSYTAKGRHRTASGGTWTVKAARVCLKQLKPMRAPFSYCTPLPSGRTWKAKAVTGEPITVRIAHGILSD